MPDSSHDLIVIGGGPAGYSAALRAAQLGLDVLCVDERPAAGGTCLHVGCIPSKALLSSTERLARARSEFASHGIEAGGLCVALDALMARKDAVVEELAAGVDRLLEKRGVARVQGRGELLGPGEVRVERADGESRVERGAHVLLASGSRPAALPEAPQDDERILDSTAALALPEVPEHLAVIGGGYVGLELGSVWARLGAEVTVVELAQRLLPAMDEALSDGVAESLEEQGLRLRLERTVERVELAADGAVLRLRSGDGDGGHEELRCSHVLVAVGRRPATRGLGLERAGVELDADGFVWTDARFRTSCPGVYAVGDLAGEPMLAHKGQLEALACVEALAGLGSGHVDYDAIPAVVYTWPEVASIGRTERSLREAGVRYRSGRASFRHDSRALCTGEAVGFVKLLAEEEGDRLLGAHLFGPHAGSLVHELVAARVLGGSLEELGRSPHAHPTLNETVREAALDVHDRAIHH